MRKPRSREKKRLAMQRYRAKRRQPTRKEKMELDLLMFGLEFVMKKYFDTEPGDVL